ncbi:MAG TPA: alpha-L-rhamnosidase C-terminal domain-containing protein [Chitinophagaceae bacterium]|nr:alpha-L-rhamnosidase C-terminal domain-containing protein [Chitinophagaceae bacterium]
MKKRTQFMMLLMTFMVTTMTVFGTAIKQPVLWKAHWITATQSQSATNTWICFRKEVAIQKRPTLALAKIAVDSKYWLWINGRRVIFEGGLKRGPDPLDTYYDEINIAPYLHEGKNTIAVLLWYFGKDGFSHNSSGKAGMVFQCITPEITLLSDQSWKARTNPAYEISPPPHPNYRLSESNVCYDARKDLGSWYLPDYKASDHGFGDALEIGIPPCAPWHQLVKRPIPQWKDYGLKKYVNEKVMPGKDADTIICQLPYNAQITPYLELSSPAGKTIRIQTDDYTGGSALNVRAVYVTRKGSQAYESYGWMNGNKVYYVIPKGVKVEGLKYRETGYDTELSGSFNCNDPFFNRLWEKARRTLYITMRDNYMDCPDRERAQWIGDEVNEAGEAFYALDTMSHLLQRKGMYELIGWQRQDSTLFGPIPAGNWDKELPCQILADVGYYGFWNYYLNTGDLKTIQDLYDGVKKYVAIWKLNDKGTVGFRKGGWTWGDWGEDIDTVLLENAWYYLALKGMRNMAEALGKGEDYQGYQKMMQGLKKTFNSEFWNGKSYRSPAYKYATDDRSQALAVVAGLADKDKYPALLRVFKHEEHASPYMEKYVLEALFMMGNADYALLRMEKRFGPMVDNPNYTTLFEGWGIGGEGYGGGTTNHAWSGGGLTLLSQYVCGISPLTPGYKLFRVKPQLGSLHYAEALVSTVRGQIDVSIKKHNKRFSMNITVPEDTKCEVYLPAVYSRILVNGKGVKPTRDGLSNVVMVKSGTFQFDLELKK